jgi:hypothetical protein
MIIKELIRSLIDRFDFILAADSILTQLQKLLKINTAKSRKVHPFSLAGAGTSRSEVGAFRFFGVGILGG